jgi:hypothetical protein
MYLRATLTLAELRSLLDQLVPLRIHLELSEKRETQPQRWIELRDPTDVSLVPGRGLRVVCSGAVRYDVGPLHSRVRIREVALLLVPSVRTTTGDDANALSLRLEIERADIAMVPDGIDALIIAGVNEILAPKAEHASWSIDRAMKLKVPMPPQLVPLDAFHLGAQWTGVTVGKDHVELEMKLSAGVTRTEAGLPTVEEEVEQHQAEVLAEAQALRDATVPKGVVP